MLTATDPEAPSALDNLVTEALDNYKKLMIDCAQGRDPKPKEIREVLTLAGKSIDEFRSRVEGLKKRLADAGNLSKADDLQDDIRRINEESQNLSSKITNLQQEHKARMEPLQESFQTTNQKLTDLTSQQRDLRVHGLEDLEKTADPKLLAELRTPSSNISQLRVLCKKDDQLCTEQKLGDKATEKEWAAEKSRVASNFIQSAGRRQKLKSLEDRAVELQRLIHDPIEGFDFGLKT
jgi:hypothetical protein